MKPRIIKNDAEYKRALEEVETLIALDPDPGTDESDRLDVISLLVEKYESEKFPVELPGRLEAIRFRMDEQGLRQRDLIPFIGNKSIVSEVLSGKRSLTVRMVRALHEGLGIPAEVLLQESQPQEEYQTEVVWEKFPLKEMVKRGWLKATLKEIKADAKGLVTRFFKPLGGAESVAVFCRRTLVERSGKSMDKYALWAWTARVIAKAESLDLPPYRAGSVNKEFIQELKHLSLSAKGPREAQSFLAKSGIALIIEPHLPRTHLDGAAMISPKGRPVIGLTIRHDRIDNFWFNLLHELIHIWKHLKSSNETFVDNLDSGPGRDPREREADRLAGEVLIPRSIWKRSDAYRQRTPDAINELALKLKIHPAIIAGRIRHDAKNFYILSQMVGKGNVRKHFPDIDWS